MKFVMTNVPGYKIPSVPFFFEHWL